MQTGQITSNILIGGIGFTSAVTRTAEGQISHVVALPPGLAGAISADGVDGLATGHGLQAADVIDLHWTASGEQKCRRGIRVDTAGANAVTFDDDPAAEGDALPAVDTAVVVGKQVSIDTLWDGDEVEMIAARAASGGVIDFRKDDGSSALAVKMVGSEAWSWVSGQSVNNPFAGLSLASIRASNSGTASSTLHIGVLYQSVA